MTAPIDCNGYALGSSCNCTTPDDCVLPGYHRGDPVTEHATNTETERREARKHGSDRPGDPTDEFVIHAFAEGAKSLWPDSRDPGWHVTFKRWLAAREAEVRAEALAPILALADAWDERETEARNEGSPGLLTYVRASREVRAALPGHQDQP